MTRNELDATPKGKKDEQMTNRIKKNWNAAPKSLRILASLCFGATLWYVETVPISAVPLATAQVTAPKETVPGYPAGTAIILGKPLADGSLNDNGRIPCFTSGKAMMAFCKAVNDFVETGDLAACSRVDLDLANSGQMHLYPGGTAGTVVKPVVVIGDETIYLVKVNGKVWVTFGSSLHQDN